MSEQLEKNKKISVSIGGISYQLVSQENESYTREIARKADDTIHQIIQQHPSLSTTQAIVLAIINAFDALTKIGNSLDEAKKEIEHIESKASKEIESAQFSMTKAQHELFSLRDTDFELKKEIIRVSELNKQLELEIASLQKRQNTAHLEPSAFKIETAEEAAAAVDEVTDDDRAEAAAGIDEAANDDKTEEAAAVVDEATENDSTVLKPEWRINPDKANVENTENNDDHFLPDQEIDRDDTKEEPFGSQDKYEEAEKLCISFENDDESESLLDFMEDGEDTEYADEPQHPGNPEDGLFIEKEMRFINELINESDAQEESFEGYKQTSLEDYFV